jgi:hypothetical protein
MVTADCIQASVASDILLSRTTILGHTDAIIGILVHEVRVPRLPYPSEFVALVLKGLSRRADSGVRSDAHRVQSNLRPN